jgi:ribosomal protein L7/L12
VEFLELEEQVQRLIADGRKISAVKLVRETTGWGLKQAKDFVDDRGETKVGLLNPDELRSLVAAGRKIQAVKRVREATGWGLKKAKDYVDALK